MAWPSQLDSDRLPLALSYNRDLADLSSTPRITNGINFKIDSGGSIDKRDGTTAEEFTTNSLKCYRSWTYETLDGAIYLIGSFLRNDGSNKYKLMYLRKNSTTPAWTDVPNLRNVNSAVYPHQGITVKGKFYSLYVPDYSSSDRIGAIIFKGFYNESTTPITYPWGIQRPSQPARIKAVQVKLTADVSATATTFNVTDTTSLPTTPFEAWCGIEGLNVTAKTPTTLTVTRAYNNTFASAHIKNARVVYKNFPNSSNAVQVTFGWKYLYGYKSITGQYSSISDYEFNPDKMSSDTGPFVNKKPVITVHGSADTTNIPTVVLYRTPDGGSNPFIVKEVTNPGDIDFDITDDQQESDAGFDDPLSDASLKFLGPDTTSNDPPPQVNSPLTVGIDFPRPSTRLVVYASRIWYAVENVLRYSGNEEINQGVPEECFPSSELRGNFFEYPSAINNLEDTQDALFTMTIKNTTIITGNTKDTFAPRNLFNLIGAPLYQPDSIAKLNKDLAWLTQDYRIILVPAGTNNPITISGPLGDELVNKIQAEGVNVVLTPFTNLNDQWLIVSAINYNTAENTRIFVYDINRSDAENHFWFTPWGIRATSVISGRFTEAEAKEKLLFFVYSNLADTVQIGRVVYLDPTSAADDLPADDSIAFDAFFDTHLMNVVEGNNFNSTTSPKSVVNKHSIVVERIKYENDDPLKVFAFLDDIYYDPKELIYNAASGLKKKPSIGYVSSVYSINTKAARIAFRFQVPRGRTKVSIQSLIPSWQINKRTTI